MRFPTDTLRARFARWQRQRQGEDVLPATLQRRRLYVLPTRAGIGFTALLFVMLLAGLNYSNSLALLLTFTLGGFAIVALNASHRNLLGLHVLGLHGVPAFAGGTAALVLELENTAQAPRHGLEIQVPGSLRSLDAGLEAGARATLSVPLPAARRGLLHVGRIRIRGNYPFGLFGTWTWLHAPLDILVYPAPRGERLPPAAPGGRELGSATLDSGRDEWRDLRPFRDGDSPRQVAWKAYARGLPLLVREYSGAVAESMEFDFSALPMPDTEARLSQLCRWVLDADARGARYALRLPGIRLPEGRGGAHRLRCLEALARFPAA